jgi:hypothetical protein
VLLFSKSLALRAAVPWGGSSAPPASLAWSASGRTLVVIATDGTAAALTPTGASRRIRIAHDLPAEVPEDAGLEMATTTSTAGAGAGADAEAGSSSVAWSLWRGGGRSDFAVDVRSASLKLRSELAHTHPVRRCRLTVSKPES